MLFALACAGMGEVSPKVWMVVFSAGLLAAISLGMLILFNCAGILELPEVNDSVTDEEFL